MIYNRWGTPITILASCGEHKMKGFRLPMRLVKVRHSDTEHVGYELVHSLRADGGVREIEVAVAAVPEETPADLKAALQAAE